MEWDSDTGAGDWIKKALEADGERLHSIAPRGFAAYARVLHPAGVRSIPGGHVPTEAEERRLSDRERDALLSRIVDTHATWAETAHAFGTTRHPSAQWHTLVRDAVPAMSPDGREFFAPPPGELFPEPLAAIVATATGGKPTPGYATLWDGWSGLLGGYDDHGRGYRTFLPADGVADDEVAERHARMLGASIHDPFNSPYREPEWQDGILSAEVAAGPRLTVSEREHVLFSGDLTLFTDPDWSDHVPWREPDTPLGTATISPNLLWPADRSWILVTDIDLDSTVVGGSVALIDALITDPHLEALALPADADLGWDADTVNA
ncbi:hypothetical protein [Microbacterium gorillae]|uniref:hypothetical protein n=1 Tax=Microbacterium gorillae TaxID=1231063 RepID=UPI00058D6A7C|nr:hypothetical protein [Microbacterium gorillae]